MKPMTFAEGAAKAKEILSKQPPLTLEEMRASVQRVQSGGNK